MGHSCHCSNADKLYQPENKGIAYLRHDLPVIEHALGEGLARGGCPEGGGEPKGLDDWQVGLQVEDGRSGPLCLLKDLATLLIQHRVDAAQSLQETDKG